MNERQKHLLERYKATDGAKSRLDVSLTRDAAAWRAMRTAGLTQGECRALTLLELTRLTPLELEEDSLLAGVHLEWNFHADDQNRDAAKDAETLKQFGCDELPAKLRGLRENVLHTVANSCMGHPSEGVMNGSWGDMNPFIGIGWMENHTVRGFDRLLAKGFGGLLKDVEEAMASREPWSVDYVRSESFYRALKAVCEAGLTLGRRYAELAKATGNEELAEWCLSVEDGAKSFGGAAQLLWFGHLLSCAEESIINANSIGRLDQLLIPYYRKDVSDGKLTKERAHELMVDFAIKLYQNYDVQATTLGGTLPDGSCACNELTDIILDATADFGELRDLSFRIHPDTPPELLEKACKLVLRGGGIPFFFNDKCFIHALNKRGISLTDARNYSPIGCVELTIPGKAVSRAVSGWFSLLKVLELTIHGGYDVFHKQQTFIHCKKLEEYGTFEEFYRAYLTNMEYLAERMVYFCRRGEISQREFGAQILFSLLTDDCVHNGREINDRGAHYNWHSVCLMGIPNTADSLMVLKKEIFETHHWDATEFRKMLEADFEGHETERLQLKNSVPKYGNGIQEVDDLAARLGRDFIAVMDRLSEPGSQFFVHLFSFLQNVYAGQKIAATPDGRHSGESFAYSLSAAPGNDKSGVTRMLESLGRQPHEEAAGGSAAIIDLHPSLFKNGVDGPKLLAELIRTAFFKLGVGQLQWNVVTAEDMQRAQDDPEHYGNLQVRVAGYSQMFKLIERNLQNHLIARHKHEN
ncbi:MAG: hypothetical protein J5743_11440 [Victivallales bacterium]|nr:hypothetical protein [Victivallales bacterium]